MAVLVAAGCVLTAAAQNKDSFTPMALDAGFGWNGSGLVARPYAQRAGQETFETYGLGGISGNDISAGTGWNGNGGLSIPYEQTVARDTFET